MYKALFTYMSVHSVPLVSGRHMEMLALGVLAAHAYYVSVWAPWCSVYCSVCVAVRVLQCVCNSVCVAVCVLQYVL